MSTPQSRIHQDWRHAEAGRAAFAQDFTRRLDTIKRCALWLADRGVITRRSTRPTTSPPSRRYPLNLKETPQ